MTKQELLTKLATEYATWDDVLEEADVATGCQCIGFGVESVAIFGVSMVKKSSWLAERERLLNKPSWNDAPESATHLAMCPHGVWRFFESEPAFQDDQFGVGLVNLGGVQTRSNYTFAIPAGYDWKQSLEERPV